MVAAVIPLERLATPDEIAKAAVFFISDDCGYITGGGFAQVWVRSQARGCR
jgi:NAD(P)-dependent dehydrogenase (short-subunit alcohol dehydrogenase family)